MEWLADPNTQALCQTMSAPARGPSVSAYTAAYNLGWGGFMMMKAAAAALAQLQK